MQILSHFLHTPMSKNLKELVFLYVLTYFLQANLQLSGTLILVWVSVGLLGPQEIFREVCSSVIESLPALGWEMGLDSDPSIKHAHIYTEKFKRMRRKRLQRILPCVYPVWCHRTVLSNFTVTGHMCSFKFAFTLISIKWSKVSVTSHISCAL